MRIGFGKVLGRDPVSDYKGIEHWDGLEENTHSTHETSFEALIRTKLKMGQSGPQNLLTLERYAVSPCRPQRGASSFTAKELNRTNTWLGVGGVSYVPDNLLGLKPKALLYKFNICLLIHIKIESGSHWLLHRPKHGRASDGS